MLSLFVNSINTLCIRVNTSNYFICRRYIMLIECTLRHYVVRVVFLIRDW